MSKAELRNFMEKTVSDPALAEKLQTLNQQYQMQIVSLEREMGIDLVPEDFAESISIY